MNSTVKALAFWGALVVAAFGIYAYSTQEQVASSPLPSATVPVAVTCADAQGLKQRATEDRRQVDVLKSDQQKIYVGNRANFFASLAVIADLTCRGTLPDLEAALKPAFEAARKAEETRSTYEMAIKWSEADFIATQVIAAFVRQPGK